MSNNRNPLTVEEKAAYFDYMASKLDYATLHLSFGGTDDLYMDNNHTPEHLASLLDKSKSYEDEANEN